MRLTPINIRHHLSLPDKTKCFFRQCLDLKRFQAGKQPLEFITVWFGKDRPARRSMDLRHGWRHGETVLACDTRIAERINVALPELKSGFIAEADAALKIYR
jgi:hypothetical protein